jgi:protocatechuate 4,5-dioxygenase beta chain
MAEIVASFGVPHTPNFPELVRTKGPDCEVARLFAGVTENLEAVQPDILVVFDSDHLNTFFMNNLPTFSVGIADQVAGPNDLTKMPSYDVPMNAGLGAHVFEKCIRGGFDLARTEEFGIDHSIMVPLHFLTPKMNVPIVPIFINGLVPPIPGAKRCYALGQAIRAAVESWPKNMRVAILASGSFSLEIGGPRIKPGERSGVPDIGWSDRVRDHLENARVNDLLEEATIARMRKAGNIGGELLNWIAMLGVIGERKPRFLEGHEGQGHAFGAWRWD